MKNIYGDSAEDRHFAKLLATHLADEESMSVGFVSKKIVAEQSFSYYSLCKEVYHEKVTLPPHDNSFA